MSCPRCHTATCGGCPERRDCADCGYAFDADHLDDRGRCGGCIERRAAESLAEANAHAEAIRVAAEAARAAERAKCAAFCDEIEQRYDRLARTTHKGITRYGASRSALAANHCAREIRTRGGAL